jgi:hypothetical protein
MDAQEILRLTLGLTLYAAAFIGPPPLIWFSSAWKITIPLGTLIFSFALFALWMCWIYIIDPGEGEPTIAEGIQAFSYFILVGATYSLGLYLIRWIFLYLRSVLRRGHTVPIKTKI